MLLRDYEIPREKIILPGKAKGGEKPAIFVRGLCGADITFLIENHLPAITKAVKRYQDAKFSVLETGSLQTFMLTVARDFPELLAEVISAAIDQLDERTREVARKLPITVQLAAIHAILKLTLEEAGGLKNLFAELRTMIGTLQSELAAVVSESTAPQEG